MDKLNYKILADTIRADILKMHYHSNASHIGSSFSCIEILIALYFAVLIIDPKKPFYPGRDRFILSKGHASSALYSVLAHRGYFSKKRLFRHCMEGGNLPGHSTYRCIPGVEASTGSLGHGLPMGVGMALSLKHDKEKAKVFVLMSDGECDEGTVWEAALFASHHKIDNLIVVIDYNKLQAFGETNKVLNLEPFAKKWESFGWVIAEVDGHNCGKIVSALKKLPFKKDKPSIVIAHTKKGKGISYMEDKLAWHYKSPNAEEYKIGLKELDCR
jgi:transketolase